MKKRWFMTALFTLALCACFTSAQAAVVSGETEYVWYNGEKGLYISDDQGGSYAILPGLGEAQKLTGLSYVIAVEPNAANDGGLSVKARDIWSSEYTWSRDYSVGEIAEVLKNAASTPVEVFATNGTVTVGTRYVKDFSSDDPTQPGTLGTNLLTGTYAGNRIVYSTDGVTWLPAEEGALNWLGSIWWDGEAFHSSDGGVSADGIHWTKTGEEQADPAFSLACELGPYRFEYAENADGEMGVYLMDQTSPDTGVLLPHMGEAAKANWVNIGKLRVWYGPNDTVILAAYDIYSRERLMVSIDYPISSLDWCLENLKTQFRSVEILASNGAVSLGMAERWSSGGYERELLRCGDGWQWAAPPFQNVQRIYPYNGKTFVVRSGGKLYASEDGLSWECLEGRGLGEDWDWREYAFAWAGDRYISCRRTVEYSSGRAGTWGEKYDPACTQVRFLNEKFETIDSYDFGRQVKAVGYLAGTCYAQISDSTGVSTEDYRKDATSTLYRSTDGKSWEKLPDIYLDVDDVMISTKGGSGVGNQPTNDPNKPLRMVAQLGQYRFALKEVWGGYTVGLMMDNAQDWMELDGMREAIQSHWILPGEVTARYTADGSVEVTVTDLSTPSMQCSVSYPAAFLDESLKAGVRTEDGVWDRYYIEYPEEEQSKPGAADVAVMALPNGEKEIVCRTTLTGGKYMYYNSVPWSNSVELLPFSGKDFMVLDKANGRVYLSADGISWHEATGNWIARNRAHNYWEYAFVWTGKNYLACCYLDNGKTGDERQVSWEVSKVFFLDENLNLAFSHDFGKCVEKVGFWNGTFYAEVGKESWDERGRYGYIDTSSQAPNTLWHSTDGVNWEATDVPQVHDALVGLQ